MGEAFDHWESRMMDHRVPAGSIAVRHQVPARQSFGLNTRSRPLPGQVLVPALAAVIEPEYPHLSASQLKTWYRCRRLWWLTKTAKVREPDKMHFAVGHALHHVAERYQLQLAKTWDEVFDPGWDRKITPESAAWIRIMAAAAVEKGFWQATPEVSVEYPVAALVGPQWLDSRGMPWLCQPDTYANEHGVRSVRKPTSLIDGSPLPDGWDRLPVFVGFADQVYLGRSPPQVRDHKSAKNKTYATTPKKLADDIQVLNYAAPILYMRPDADQVEFAHNVCLKSEHTADGCYEVKAAATVDRVRVEWQRTMQAAADMKLLREVLPVSADAIKRKDPHRADRWTEVKSAIEDGCASESCNAYGGCPFRDMCNHRATAAQVVARLDTGAAVAGPEPPPKTFGLAARAGPSTHQPQAFGLQLSKPTINPTTSTSANSNQEPTMPFPPRALPIPASPDVYMLDPENAKVQYRARKFENIQTGNPATVMLLLWPHVDVEPNWSAVPVCYQIEWDRAALSATPYPGVALKGYHESMLAVGTPAEECAWTDATGVVHSALLTLNLPTQPSMPAPVPSAGTGASPAVSVPAKPPADGAFGLKTAAPAQTMAQGKLNPGVGAALAAQSARAAASVAVPPPQTFEPKIGQVVQVAGIEPSTEFFRSLAASGARGKIVDISPGDGQPCVDVMMDDGVELPAVAVGRFTLVQDVAPAAPAPAQNEATQLAAFKHEVKGYCNKQVEIVFNDGRAPVRCVLETAHDLTGLMALSGKLLVAWESLAGIALVPDDTPAPGEVVKKGRGKGKKTPEAAAVTVVGDPQPVSNLAIGQAHVQISNPVEVDFTKLRGAPPLFTSKDVAAKFAELDLHLTAVNHCRAQLAEMLKGLG